MKLKKTVVEFGQFNFFKMPTEISKDNGGHIYAARKVVELFLQADSGNILLEDGKHIDLAVKILKEATGESLPHDTRKIIKFALGFLPPEEVFQEKEALKNARAVREATRHLQ